MQIQLSWQVREIPLELLHFHQNLGQRLHLPYPLRQLAMAVLGHFQVHYFLLDRKKKSVTLC